MKFMTATGTTIVDRDLYHLLIQLGPIWKRTEALLTGPPAPVFFDEAVGLRSEAMALDFNLANWQRAQAKIFRPTMVDTGLQASSDPGAGYWHGRIDAYIDLYVATLWNISRVSRCLLITLIIRLSGVLNEETSYDCDHQEALRLVNDVIASIPYILSEDLQVFLRERDDHTEINNPGRPVCGLLLMHSIYVVSCLEIFPITTRDYMQTCLIWIGRRMGIGQAAFLAQVCRPSTSPWTIEPNLSLEGPANPQSIFRQWMFDRVRWFTHLADHLESIKQTKPVEANGRSHPSACYGQDSNSPSRLPRLFFAAIFFL